MISVELRPVESLVPYANNPKKHPKKQIENLAESIRRYGFRNPILIDADGVIVAGHGRFEAAKVCGLAEIPCILVDDLNPEQIRAFRILDNKLAESAWDFDMLNIELPEIDVSGFDLDFCVPQLGASEFDVAMDNHGKKQETDEYRDFIERLTEVPKTTDDCYTPKNVYAAVRDWCVKEYGLAGRPIVRPFYPGGDYERFDYPENCVVIDNPPFSISAQIQKFYIENKIDYFLFANGLTVFSGGTRSNIVVAGVDIVYENKAKINTSFLTNLGNYKILISAELFTAVQAANSENIPDVSLPKYEYPDCILTAASAYPLAEHGCTIRIPDDECHFIRALDAQKSKSVAIFGGGFLLSSRITAEKLAAEKLAAEKLAAEKWELSDREREIVSGLGGGAHD